MKIITNPTGSTLTGKFAGVEYPIGPGESIEMEKAVAQHIHGQLKGAGLLIREIKPVFKTKYPFVTNRIFKQAAENKSKAANKKENNGPNRS